MKRGTIRQRHTRNCPRTSGGGWVPHKCKGAWEFILDAGRDDRGRRRQASKSGFATKREAEVALQQHVDELRCGVDLLSSVTVEQYLAQWLVNKRALRPSTLKSYREHVQLYLVPYLGKLRLRQLKAEHVDSMLSQIVRAPRPRAISATTLRRIHATLRVALNDAVRRRVLAFNPAVNVELPREYRDQTVAWTGQQVAVFFRSSARDRLYPLFHLVTMTGLRRGEAVGLRWADVDLDQGQLRVRQQAVQLGGRVHLGPPKTRSGTRTVPIDRGTIQVLRNHLARQQQEGRAWGGARVVTGLVFTRENGAALSPEQVSRRFKPLARQAGLPVIRFHDLRHTSASLALAAGVPMKVVSERLGHSSTGITADLYTHVAPALARDAADAIARSVQADCSQVGETLAQEPETRDQTEEAG